MKKMRLLWQIMKTVTADVLIGTFLIYFCVLSFVLSFIEPGINSVTEGAWFCFTTITTIGYGDLIVVTTLGRVLTVFIAIYGIIIVAIMTGVVVSYFNEFTRLRAKENLAHFLEQLEKLPELSKEELEEISEAVKNNRYRI